MALKSLEMKIFKKNFFCSFCVKMSIHAKNCVSRLNGLACGQYIDKEEKNTEKNFKRPLKHLKGKFRKTEKKYFSHRPKEHIFFKLAYWVENCDL